MFTIQRYHTVGTNDRNDHIIAIKSCLKCATIPDSIYSELKKDYKVTIIFCFGFLQEIFYYLLMLFCIKYAFA